MFGLKAGDKIRVLTKSVAYTVTFDHFIKLPEFGMLYLVGEGGGVINMASVSMFERVKEPKLKSVPKEEH